MQLICNLSWRLNLQLAWCLSAGNFYPPIYRWIWFIVWLRRLSLANCHLSSVCYLMTSVYCHMALACDCIAYTFATCDQRSNNYFRFVLLEKQVLLYLVTLQNQVSLGSLFITILVVKKICVASILVPQLIFDPCDCSFHQNVTGSSAIQDTISP